jgi:cell division protein FtsN
VDDYLDAMSATKKRKRSRKPVRFQMSRLAILGWCFGLLVALLWMFLLGLFVGKGINPASINFAEIKKRMIDQGVWPGTGKTHQGEETSLDKKTRNHIPLEDLEFYEKLAKKKANFQKENKEGTPPQQAATSQKQQRPATGKFSVQLASFKEFASAKKFAARFKDLKPQATIREVDLAHRGRWYRVQIGTLSSRDEATALAKRFKKKYGLQAYVVSLDGGEE